MKDETKIKPTGGVSVMLWSAGGTGASGRLNVRVGWPAGSVWEGAAVRMLQRVEARRPVRSRRRLVRGGRRMGKPAEGARAGHAGQLKSAVVCQSAKPATASRRRVLAAGGGRFTLP
jgi:hypothetical protein